MFDLQSGTVQCPFCNVAIPQDLDDGPTDPHVGGALDPLNPPVPTPGAMPTPGGSTPDPLPIEGTLNPNEPVMHDDTPAPSAGPSMSGAQAMPIKVAAILGGAFLAYKIGLLDNLLGLVGMGPAPAPPPVVDTTPVELPPTPMPDAPPPTAEPTTQPGSDGPITAPVEAPPAAPAAPVAAEWAFEGKVTDLLSMKPVKGAVLLFMTQAEDETFEAKSDEKGRFTVKLPARKGNDGYKLVIDHPEYIAEYFDETDPPYRTWTQARRRQLRAAKPSHKAWTAASADAVRRDVLLFPEFQDK